MARYIDKDLLLKDIDESVVFSVRSGVPSPEIRGANKIIDRIKNAPTADVAEVKHGYWREIKQGYGIFDYCFKCSNCGKTTPPNAFAVAPDYCPRCGAKMDKENTQ